MVKCYICNCEITKENESEEHIIANGIAGHLTSKKILCLKHNNELSKLDYELCEDLNFCTNLLNPKRDRGKNPKAYYKNEDGLIIVREASGNSIAKPIISVKEIEKNKKQISFHSYYSSTEENRNITIKKLKDVFLINAKSFNFTKEELEKKLQEIEELALKNTFIAEDPKMYFQCQFNKNGKLFISIFKIALNYYFANNLPYSFVEEVLTAFKNQDLKFINKCGNYFYPQNFYLDNSIYHTIILKGDAQKKVLYCLISLYGVLNTFVWLSKNYNGKNFLYSYCYDLRNNKIINFNQDINLNLADINQILEPVDISKQMSKAFNNFLNFFVAYEYNTDDLYRIIENIFKALTMNQYIQSEEEYKEIFYNKFIIFFNSDKQYKILKHSDRDNLFDLIYKVYSYERYRNTMFLQFLSQQISRILMNILIHTPQILNNKENLISQIKHQIFSIKTDNAEFNKMIHSEKENLNKSIDMFIQDIYKQLILYKKLLNSD